MNTIWIALQFACIIYHQQCLCEEKSNFSVNYDNAFPGNMMDIYDMGNRNKNISSDDTFNQTSNQKTITTTSFYDTFPAQMIRLEYLCRSVSFVFIVISLILMFSLRLPKTSKFFVHKQLLVAYFLGDTCLLLAHDDIRLRIVKYKNLCILNTVLYQYFALSFYSCMLVEGIHIYLMLKNVFHTYTHFKRYLIYISIGWGTPLLIIIIYLATRFDAFADAITCYRFQVNYTWLYKGPVAALLGLNTICFIGIISIAVKTICQRNNGQVHKVLATFRAMLVLLPLLGVTFLVGFAQQVHPIATAYIFAIVNGFLGFFIFVFHVVLDHEVRNAFKKDVFGITKKVITESSPNHSPNMKTKSLSQESTTLSVAMLGRNTSFKSQVGFKYNGISPCPSPFSTPQVSPQLTHSQHQIYRKDEFEHVQVIACAVDDLSVYDRNDDLATTRF